VGVAEIWEAFNAASESSLEEVEILGGNNAACDPADLERLANKAEACLPHQWSVT
jgi:hypothetical protein